MAGYLYFATGLAKPGRLWLQRMVDGLGPAHIACLVNTDGLAAPYRERYGWLDPASGEGTRLGWWARRRCKTPEARLRAVMERPEVGAVFVNYMKEALKHENLWRDAPKPVYVHCHGQDVLWQARSMEKPWRLTHAPDYRERALALASSATLVANSWTMRQDLIASGVKPERVLVKYFGVPAASAPPRFEATNEITILYLGRLIDFKGPELVLRAFELACAQGMQGRLVIAGSGPLRPMCELMRAESAYRERIELVGEVSEAEGEKLRAAAHVFAAHNRTGPVTQQSETFGVSVAEAMGTGLPVVSGRSGSLPELIESGTHGLLVEPGDVEAQASTFVELANHPELRQRLGNAAWQRARERFSPEAEAAFLKQLLHGERPRDMGAPVPEMQQAAEKVEPGDARVRAVAVEPAVG